MRKISVLSLVLLGLLMGSLVFAQNSTGTASTSSSTPGWFNPAIWEARQDMKEEREDFFEENKEFREQNREEIKNTLKNSLEENEELREQFRQQLLQTATATIDEIKEQREQMMKMIRENREDAKQFIEEKREALKQSLEERREAFKDLVEQKREEIKTLMEQRREEFKNKLEGFKDEKSKEVAQRVDENLDKINKNRTDHFASVVDRLEKILANIESRADRAQTAGLDVSAVRTAITEAESAIALARTAIGTQAGNTYVVTLTDENSLGQDLRTAREKLYNDLKVVKDAVEKARDAVHKSATTLGQVQGINDDSSSTSTSSN